MKKVILHIAEAPGGVERYLINLISKMKAHDDCEHILVCSKKYDVARFRGLVREVSVVEEMQNPISIRNDLKTIFTVRKLIKNYRPDVVFCHSSKAGAIGRLANIGIRNKMLYNAHGWSFNIRSKNQRKLRMYEIVERLLAPMTDRIICISEYEKKSAIEHRICRADKLVVINNGIDFDEYRDVDFYSRSDMGIPEDAFVVGMIGRLTKQKAADVFVQMAAEVKKEIDNAYFVIVGDDIGTGRYREMIDGKIEEMGLSECFKITGWVKEPLRYAGVFDVATLLSRWEGFGLVLPEYMLIGKPIVASRADAIPYVVGDAGLLFDVDDYKKAAELVISLNRDGGLRDKLIESGKQRVGSFDAARMAEECHDLIMEL